MRDCIQPPRECRLAMWSSALATSMTCPWSKAITRPSSRPASTKMTSFVRLASAAAGRSTKRRPAVAMSCTERQSGVAVKTWSPSAKIAAP